MTRQMERFPNREDPYPNIISTELMTRGPMPSNLKGKILSTKFFSRSCRGNLGHDQTPNIARLAG